jgi:GMP synthase-like glutamine amidotransferase
MKILRIHYFQHVSFEGLGSIEDWIELNGHSLTSTKFFESTDLPSVEDIDWLIVMGGPMSIYDEEKYPWLRIEKQFIKKAVESGKTVLGICLGSQLISDALGAKVYQNKEKEIGWFNIELTSAAMDGKLLFDMGNIMKVFHWHGDTFDLPSDAIHLARSEGCRNQAFVYYDKVVALQFHLETGWELLLQMIKNGKNELNSGKYIQTEEEILNNKQLIVSNRKVLFKILNRLAQ